MCVYKNVCSTRMHARIWLSLFYVDKKCPQLFCFEGNLITALLNSLNGWNLQKTVKLFYFEDLLITALLNSLNGLWSRENICEKASAAGEGVLNAILKLNTLFSKFSSFSSSWHNFYSINFLVFGWFWYNFLWIWNFKICHS